MSRQVLPHEVRELRERMPGWMPAFVNWSVRWSFTGWPLVRRVPLHVSALIVKLYARGYL